MEVNESQLAHVAPIHANPRFPPQLTHVTPIHRLELKVLDDVGVQQDPDELAVGHHELGRQVNVVVTVGAELLQGRAAWHVCELALAWALAPGSAGTCPARTQSLTFGTGWPGRNLSQSCESMHGWSLLSPHGCKDRVGAMQIVDPPGLAGGTQTLHRSSCCGRCGAPAHIGPSQLQRSSSGDLRGARASHLQTVDGQKPGENAFLEPSSEDDNCVAQNSRVVRIVDFSRCLAQYLPS